MTRLRRAAAILAAALLWTAQPAAAATQVIRAKRRKGASPMRNIFVVAAVMAIVLPGASVFSFDPPRPEA